jgi:hypothetical protein
MKTVEHKLGALIGPNGELAMGWSPPEDVDWGMLWDSTEDWNANESDIRRAVITVHVPAPGKAAHVELSGAVEPQEQAK